MAVEKVDGARGSMGKEKKSSSKSEHSEKSEKKSNKKAHGIHARKVHGGYHIQHHDESGAPIAGAEHVVPDMAALHDHIEDNLAGEGEAAAPAAEPQPQAEPTMAPMGM